MLSSIEYLDEVKDQEMIKYLQIIEKDHAKQTQQEQHDDYDEENDSFGFDSHLEDYLQADYDAEDDYYY